MYPSNEQGLKDVNSSGVRGYIRSRKPIVNKLIIMSLQDQASMPRLVDGGQESKAASRSLLHVQACYYCIPTSSKPTRLRPVAPSSRHYCCCCCCLKSSDMQKELPTTYCAFDAPHLNTCRERERDREKNSHAKSRLPADRLPACLSKSSPRAPIY